MRAVYPRAPVLRLASRSDDELFVRLADQAAELREVVPNVTTLLCVVILLHAGARGLLPAGEEDVVAVVRRGDAWRKLRPQIRRVFNNFNLKALVAGADGPKLSDATLCNVVAMLCLRDGGAVRYDELPIEHIGAVYETLMAAASRRRSGSHFTPPALTGPIVRAALAPVLARLGGTPTREQILLIKVCDPAMGAGAFLLEACRQLAEALVKCTGMSVAEARGLVAQRCIHGVDKDPVAVDLARVSLWLLVADRGVPLSSYKKILKCGDSLDGFEWEREFVEVFARERPGFDVIVGNPPFMGGVRISGATSQQYLKRIVAKFPGTGGQADLVAYFFRLSFEILREGGTLGLLATNTISQGATRKASLQAIVRAGGRIYAAERHVPWPGAAAVIYSVVWIVKNAEEPRGGVLDGAACAQISAFLVPHGGSEDPLPLVENRGLAFKGIEPYGDGFVFEDGNPNANTLTELAMVLKTPGNEERIIKYLGGEEFTRSSTQTATRWVIDFNEMGLEEAGRWPQLLKIVERRVRPERATKAADVARWPWWQFWRTRPELRRATRGLARVLALADTSKHLSLAFVATDGLLLNKTIVVVALAEDAAFAVLQSRVHEVWARFFGSSMKADLRYTARDVFETFPFPEGWRTSEALARAGGAYHRYRAELMRAAGQGLTAMYNRFHEPGEDAPEVQELRRLHAEMDRAVLDAYGWSDIGGECEFSRMGAETRLRWAQVVRDEVLARLLVENTRRGSAGRGE